MESHVIGATCLSCESPFKASALPDACFRCGARFDRQAPALVVSVCFGFADGRGLGLTIRAQFQRHGVWGPELRGVEERLRRHWVRPVED
ncbi:MAG: hypothetical protein AAGH15_27045 [Myxococcota bacterium]